MIMRLISEIWACVYVGLAKNYRPRCGPEGRAKKNLTRTRPYADENDISSPTNEKGISRLMTFSNVFSLNESTHHHLPCVKIWS